MAKNSNRKFLEKVYGKLYSFAKMETRLICAYCGDVRSTVDHVPPLSVVAKVGMREIRKRDIDLLLYPCCTSCNSLLGARMLATYDERLLFIYKSLMNKIESVTLWSDDEIDELGGNLKRMVRARQLHIRRELILRLRGTERNLAGVDK